MAFRPRLARPTMRGQDPQRHVLPEAGVQAQRTVLLAWWEVYRSQDRGWPSAAYSSSYDSWQVHKGEAGRGFGQNQCGGRCVRCQDGGHVLDPELFAQGVDAHNKFHTIIGLLSVIQRQGMFARLCLVFGGDAVFQFNANNIRT